MAPLLFEGIICGKALKCKSFQGQPQSRQDELEMVEQDHKDLTDGRLLNKPLCYNHDTGTSVGVVKGSHIDGDGNLCIRAEVNDDTVEAREMQKWILEGNLRALSLQHYPDTNEPVEVSLCWKGARPGTVIKNIIYEDTNSGLYTCDKDPDDRTTVKCSTASDRDCIIVPIKASIISMDPPAPQASAPSAPQAQAQAPVPTEAPAPGPGPAPGDSEMKDAEAEFVATNKVQQILSGKGPNMIPSRAEKSEILATTSALELEKLEAQAELARVQSELAQSKAEIERIQKDKESQQAAEVEKKADMTRRMVGDFAKTFAGEADTSINNVLASFNPEQLKFMANLERGVRASVIPAAAPADEEMKEEEEHKKHMRRWFEAKNSKKPQSIATNPQTTEKTNNNAPMSYSLNPTTGGTGNFQSWQLHRSNAAPVAAPAPVQASSISRPNNPQWGRPIQSRPSGWVDPFEAKTRSVKASYQDHSNYHAPSSMVTYLPGEGPNFPHGFMNRVGQIEVFMQDLKQGTPMDRMSISASFTSEGVQNWRQCMEISESQRQTSLASRGRKGMSNNMAIAGLAR